MAKNQKRTVFADRPEFLPDCKKMEEVFEQVQWKKIDTELRRQNGEVLFSLKGVEAPENWSQVACDIVASKYFRCGEKSVRQLIHRVVATIVSAGQRQGYFRNRKVQNAFAVDLTWILVNQMASFNSPVWFNLGLFGFYKAESKTFNFAWNPRKKAVDQEKNSFKRAQVSACFIQSVDDSVEGLFDLAKTEARLFKFGSGSGTNFSNVRSRYDDIESGGKSSGLMSFLDMLDRGAAAIKSGGTTRRAAKMVCLDVSHPEILDFINWKVDEEKKAKALIKAGYSSGIDGEAYKTVSGQNSNNSVRVSGEFIAAVKANSNWILRSPRTKKEISKIPAGELWRQIASAAHQTGDPGLQFTDIIAKWNPCRVSGEIRASNPCSEFMFLDNTACNLASLNLLQFMSNEGFKWPVFERAVRVMILAQDILVDEAGYPTESLAKNSHGFRPLGLGFCGLGAFLMRQAMAYDSAEARTWASVLCDFMSAIAFETSLEIAKSKGPFQEFNKNKKSVLEVLRLHAENGTDSTKNIWRNILSGAKKYGLRNSQLTLMAPTGTIGLVLDSETTGIEPEFALEKSKTMVGGGVLKTYSQALFVGLKKLGYSERQLEEIKSYLDQNSDLSRAPGIKPEHLTIFATAHGGSEKLTISAEGHLLMMSALQRHLCGAISKTVNLPASTTVEEIQQIFLRAYELGLKSVSVYKDGSKGAQPLSISQSCAGCGGSTRLVGGCYLCDNCGTSTGCVN